MHRGRILLSLLSPLVQPGRNGAQPALGEGNTFEGNSDLDQLLGGDLPVPDIAPSIP